jgi:predicted metal-binding membrane protein
VAELEASGRAVAPAWRPRIVVWSCVLGVAVVAWSYLVHLESQMASAMQHDAMMASMRMATDTRWSVAEFAYLFAMWAVMMVAMMAPAAGPVLALVAGAQRSRATRRPAFAVPAFALGYAIVWIGFSASAALAQWALHDTALLSPQMATTAPIGAAVLIGAGVYQLLPIKRACLVRCRSPLAFLMTRWRDGTLGALRMGLRHGSWCLGCCWALMTVLFAVGVMNLAAVAMLALFVLAEKTGPRGVLVARLGGVALIASGVLMLTGARLA